LFAGQSRLPLGHQRGGFGNNPPSLSAFIDGEFVAPSSDGTTDLSVLQNQPKGKSTKIGMVAFGLLLLNGD
jgi:ATP-dependent DNA ligase